MGSAPGTTLGPRVFGADYFSNNVLCVRLDIDWPARFVMQSYVFVLIIVVIGNDKKINIIKK